MTPFISNCPYCGVGHVGTCPRVKAIEYFQNGMVKRVEFHEPKPVTLFENGCVASKPAPGAEPPSVPSYVRTSW